MVKAELRSFERRGPNLHRVTIQMFVEQPSDAFTFLFEKFTNDESIEVKFE